MNEACHKSLLAWANNDPGKDKREGNLNTISSPGEHPRSFRQKVSDPHSAAAATVSDSTFSSGIGLGVFLVF